MRTPIPFTKMHGLTNDYVVVDGGRTPLADPAALAQATCSRRTGVGAEGMLVLTEGGPEADFRMQMYNVDGSEAEMCGNGLRCATLFALTEGLVTGAGPWICMTGAGPLEVATQDGGATVTVAMGRARVEPNLTLEVEGQTVSLTPASMGNPHAVVFVEDIDQAPVETLGPLIETHPHFPDRTNVEFVEVVNTRSLRQRTWERGCGETGACGTGACAVAAVAVKSGRAGREVQIDMLGGRLDISVDADLNIRMCGPAVKVFEGSWAAPIGRGDG